MVFEKNFIIIVFYIFINMYLLKEIFLVLSVYGRDVVMGNFGFMSFFNFLFVWELFFRIWMNVDFDWVIYVCVF